LKPRKNASSTHGTRAPENSRAPSSEAEAMFSRFSLLIDELTTGTIQRNKFERWEIDILLDAKACGFTRPSAVLRRYREAVRRQLANGATVPMKLSEFLKSRKTRAPVKSATV
jgi:hypothetical protein